MKKEARLLKTKAVDSLLLSIDHFNRQWDVGRTEAVLILLDHSFEMLLKASILHRGGRIREPGEEHTIGFDKCIRRGLSNVKVKFITEDQAFTLQTINGLRDAAQHHLVDISEGHLYIQAQSGVTLFADILLAVFDERLRHILPDRALPVATIAPLDPISLFREEMAEIKRLLAPKTRRRTEAEARLRGLAIMDGALRGGSSQPSAASINTLANDLRKGKSFDDLFPGISAVNFVTDGSGIDLSLRLTKREGIPVQTVPEGDVSGAVVAVRRVNELDFYNLGHKQLAEKTGLSGPRLTAALRYLALHEDSDCCKDITIGKTRFLRYSQNAIPRIEALKGEPGMDVVWADHNPNN